MEQFSTVLVLYISFYCKFLECDGFCSDRFQDTDYNWSWDQKTYNCNGICHSISSLFSRSACPCDENQYWCEKNLACNSVETPCIGACPSHIYPIFNQKQDSCVTCDAHYKPNCNRTVIDQDTFENVCMAWCSEKSMCVDVSLDNEKYDGCGEKCFQNHLTTSQ